MSGGLFDPAGPAAPHNAPDAPLAERMRPREIGEILGHETVLGPGTVLRRLLDEDRLPSLILWGPPGSGKTTLARALAGGTGARFEALSAVLAGVKEVREVVARARTRRERGGRTLLFVDEIHRFNRAQQDAFLPHVEDGTITLVGATTENPAFHVNPPLLSRSRLVVLERLGPEALAALVDRALADPERGLGGRGLTLLPDARDALVAGSGGDARRLLNVLEAAAGAAAEGDEIDAAAVRAAAGRTVLAHDRAGDEHFNLASALQKSIRSGDVQAGVYWCTRLLESGEDPLFVARRLVVMASEDVGMAQPFLLPIVMAARDAAHFLGMPECGMALVQAVVALASAPKSNAVAVAWHEARDEVRRTGSLPVPLHLRNAATPTLGGIGWGKGYQYAHDHPDALVDQEHFPDGVSARVFYRPKESGREADVARHLERLEAFRRERDGEDPRP